MSFYRILSTLCRQVVFHIVPHFSCGRQKSGAKNTARNRRSRTKSKIPCTFYPALLKLAKQIVNNHSFCFSHQTDQGEETEGLEMEGLERER
jgi:hypothetical protein